MSNETAFWSHLPRLMERVSFYGLVLFALAIPHSIAVAQIGFSISALCWLLGALAEKRVPVIRTPLTAPIMGFSLLTILSAVFSIEPQISLPKLRSLTLFLLVYLIADCLSKQQAWMLLLLVMISGLTGVVFSFGEKIIGRGVILTSVAPQSPLAASGLQAGDTIWMVERTRVSSIAEVHDNIRSRPPGEKISIEALHDGDPIPVELTMTEEIRQRPEFLGIAGEGRTRQFRVSGFTRHFLTYAEQMQLFALLLLGCAITSLRRQVIQWKPTAICFTGFILFSLALLLTATRGVIASFIVTLVVMATVTGSRRVAWMVLPLALPVVALSIWFLVSIRTQDVAQMVDDSAQRRIGYMKAGLRAIPHYPVLGAGMDSLKLHWHEWGFPGDYITHTHSTPIQIALDRGLPALGCYLWLIATLGMMLWRQYREGAVTDDLLPAALPLGSLGGVIGFFLSSLTNYNFGDSETLMLLLFFVALSLVTGRRGRSPADQESHR
jgi:hypothetical protein